MALIHCPYCGHNVSDKAERCPSCGAPLTPEAPKPVEPQPVFAEQTPTPPPAANNEPDFGEAESHTGRNILLYNIVVVLVLALVCGFYCYQQPQHSKSLRYESQQSESLRSESATDCQETSTTETTSESDNYEKAVSSNPNNAYVGVWEFTDKHSHTWVLTVNGDETAEIHMKGSEGRAYASWYKYYSMKHAQFNCSEKGPRIMFPGSELKSYNDYEPETCGNFCVDGQYIYYNYSAADAKNPEMRLAIKKENN